MQSSSTRESYGEMLPNSATNQYSLSGFSPEQIQSLTKLIKIAVSQAFERHLGPYQSSTQSITQPITQSITQPITQSIAQPITQSVTQQSSLAKKKRNLRSRNQKKRKAQAQVICVTVQNQEVEHSLGACNKNKPSKHVVLKQLVRWDRICTSLHAVIQSDRMTTVAGMIRIDYEVNGMRRLGIG